MRDDESPKVDNEVYKFKAGQRVYYRRFGYKGFKLYGHVAENYTAISLKGFPIHMVTIFIDGISKIMDLPESKLRLVE